MLELVLIFKDLPATNEERAFVRTTGLAIEECLKRKLKVESVVSDFS